MSQEEQQKQPERGFVMELTENGLSLLFKYLGKVAGLNGPEAMEYANLMNALKTAPMPTEDFLKIKDAERAEKSETRGDEEEAPKALTPIKPKKR